MKIASFITILLSISTILCANAPGFPRGKAPAWQGTAVVGTTFQKLSSADYAGKYLVLLFYPFDFTYVCPTELIAFSEASDKFAALNANVVGVSVDSHFTHLAWVKTPRTQGGVGQLNFPLLADISKDVSRDYGVLVEDKNDDLYGASLRGLFIIDQAGIIRHMQINDAPVGRSVDEVNFNREIF
jgi:alkyl hydroperoxide reductase subunit AhpC